MCLSQILTVGWAVAAPAVPLRGQTLPVSRVWEEICPQWPSIKTHQSPSLSTKPDTAHSKLTTPDHSSVDIGQRSTKCVCLWDGICVNVFVLECGMTYGERERKRARERERGIERSTVWVKQSKWDKGRETPGLFNQYGGNKSTLEVKTDPVTISHFNTLARVKNRHA